MRTPHRPVAAAVAGLVATLVVAAPAEPAAAAAPVTITSPELAVSVDSGFPRVISYTRRATGDVLHGNEHAIGAILVNGTTYTPTVTSTPSVSGVDYALAFSGVTIRSRLSVAGSVVEFKVTAIEDTAALRVHSLAIPEHHLVSVRSDQPGAALSTATMHTATTGTGDTFTPVTANTPADPAATTVMYGLANTGKLAAAIDSNSLYDTPSGGTARENGRISKRITDQGGYRRAGLWSGAWLHRPAGAADGDTEPLPYARVAITADRNADSVVDWQDAAIAYRDIWTPPTGWQDTANRVVQRIPFNFASQATHPFAQTLDETKRVSLATDGLGQFVLLKGYASEGHDSAHMDYKNVGSKLGGAVDLNTLTSAGHAYNADFGVHVNATEEYPVSATFDPAHQSGGPGWDWLDQSYYVDTRKDGQSGQRLKRLQDLKAAAPGLDFLYVDVWYGDGYVSRKLQREISGLGLQLTTEFPNTLTEQSLWHHWATDVNYGGSDLKGINSTIARFVANHAKDDWIARNPLLGGAEVTAYEGWQGKKDFTAFLNTTFGVNLPTKYLQESPVVQWTPDTVTLANGTTVTTTGNKRRITTGGRTVLSGDTYLLPRDGKLYHWNDKGGSTTWTLPAGWSAPKLHALTDTGRRPVGDLTVGAGNQVTINATARTAYVVSNGAAPAPADPRWGEGTPVKDPSFYAGDLAAWNVSGTGAAVTRNAQGQSELTFAPGTTPAVSQQLTGFTPGTYAASVWVSTPTGRAATLTVTPAGGPAASVYADSSTLTNSLGGSEKNGTRMQRMKVLFDVPAGRSTATLGLSAAAGAGTVYLDDVRVVPSARTPLGGHWFAEDFENTDAGWGPFAFGGAGGSATDPRTHIAQRNAPYTQAGWNGKLVDDVISGRNSLKSHEERTGLVYRTLPQTLRLTQGRSYKVTFGYESGFSGDYQFVTGSGSTETTTALNQARTPTTFTKTFTAGADAWIGVRKVTPENSHNEADLILDDLTVDDLGPAEGGELLVPQGQMSVHAVDSQETAGENGSAANVLDGDSSTLWHTQWYAATAPMPHEITLDLGASYNVSALHYLPRQSQTNGRIADYQVFTSTDGLTWGPAAASGTFPDSTAQQDVSFPPRTARYLRLKATREVGGNAWTSVAELNVGHRP
ncbi:endo-alpha-N-acetylgalactosaminidase family protein [Streptomyces sp. NBC_01408]|uniref:endo-alpha-N-acetylgalactosaminidase family protein n=1 Tax=Streptomyces sp. NBC_01408 TaxID=2903855 RepID=UPI002250DB98|nr:endo-alpha-N-acetylgalactosaminidase family protein [Streptomyces sp. NBC_01408]MCX4695302.1 endo-alpha-N-acetylgalactosaminidase family protein [Streptomyces sp. NBC_01408]